jgi:hypothetical protein
MQTFGAVASRSHPCRPVSASILIWLAGFPTDFLVVGSHVCCGFVFLRRGFPTDFPVVGLIGEMVGPNRSGGSLPISPRYVARGATSWIFRAGARLHPVGDGGEWKDESRRVWRASVSTMATPASIHAISALVKVAYGLSITAQARSSIESRVAWSGARLSTPCTQLAVNFELATEAINGEFVKG